jgi:hypothetical protein
MMNIPVDFLNELKRADGENVSVVINCRLLYQIISVAQLATRNPSTAAGFKKELQDGLKQFEPTFAEFPELWKSIKRGNDPAFDAVFVNRRNS